MTVRTEVVVALVAATLIVALLLLALASGPG
jgi:hypothetical protein